MSTYSNSPIGRMDPAEALTLIKYRMRSVLSLIEEINKGFVMEWFEELKRRGVYKATAVYTVVAWSLIQAIGVINSNI